MNLFDKDRPDVSPQRKAILIDGSAIPTFVITVEPNGLVEVSALLREYESGEDFSYRYYHAEIRFDRLEEFFTLFDDDPEWTLEKYFSWKPQRTNRRKHTLPDAKRITVVSDQPQMSDLL